VFWGYELADGREVSFFACALLSDVDCDARAQAICPTRTMVLESRETTGKMVHRSCRPIAIGNVGNAPPGCVDDVDDAELLIGLVECG
jgi:hypothetical protein